MNTLANIQELARALRNMIRTGIIVETDLNAGRCRVQTGGMCTDWLQWLTCRAGRSRTWWAPSVGEQVLILAVGGELDTAFVLPGIYSGDNPAPSASADALHIRFPDGAVIEYEPETSALTVCQHAAHARTSRYITDTTKERYHQCQNVNCSATFITYESVQRYIVKPGEVHAVRPHPLPSGQQIMWM
ncbi:TPA: DNA-binding transcriptional regulator [Escherichia coli]|nr:DNA-binding transcriptional regulator [Escherichia coli]ELL3177039.1 DNA-binding transcriptional regulator [Escherichia coli]MDM1608690.1 DNA-binding transcriptional regulator [Escherichia coli]HAW3744264.1 DNA-binding transcriptional regulator [Escherichia coli]HAW4248656.1 DNA-binding transcriptional regulator [Escherichia coli]